MPRNYAWMPTEIPPKCKLSKWEKQSLQRHADQFVTEFYRPTIKPPPDDPSCNYIVDFSTKWHGAYLQFIAKYACPGPNVLSPFFEIAFARLGYFRHDSWNIWARRHNDQWLVMSSSLTLQGCFEEMRTNPWFHL
ncbi:MAG: hypothetical protein WCQ21_03960 [Verrucomicrobiota bacterium]|jgi:hypothetical protein